MAWLKITAGNVLPDSIHVSTRKLSVPERRNLRLGNSIMAFHCMTESSISLEILQEVTRIANSTLDLDQHKLSNSL